MAYSVEDNETVDNIKYDDAQLSATGEVLEIRDVWMPTAQSWSPVYTHLSLSLTWMILLNDISQSLTSKL